MSVIFILMSISSISHVDFKKCSCRPVDFNGPTVKRVVKGCYGKPSVRAHDRNTNELLD